MHPQTKRFIDLCFDYLAHHVALERLLPFLDLVYVDAVTEMEDMDRVS